MEVVSGVTLAGSGNITGDDPQLGPLAENGGPTTTHALLAGSPAIDAGNPAFTPPPDFDQRGALHERVADGDGAGGARIDIGAYERQSLPPEFFVVDTLVDEEDGDYSAGDRSLREVIRLPEAARWRQNHHICRCTHERRAGDDSAHAR